MVSAEFSFPLNSSKKLFKNNETMDSEDDYTTTLDLINVPILSQQERQDIFSQDSYDSQTQTQTQKIAQPPIKVNNIVTDKYLYRYLFFFC